MYKSRLSTSSTISVSDSAEPIQTQVSNLVEEIITHLSKATRQKHGGRWYTQLSSIIKSLNNISSTSPSNASPLATPESTNSTPLPFRPSDSNSSTPLRSLDLNSISTPLRASDSNDFTPLRIPDSNNSTPLRLPDSNNSTPSKPPDPTSCTPQKECVKRKREDGEDEDTGHPSKERPSLSESLFKSASNKPILLNSTVQKKYENMCQEYANMEINIGDLEQPVQPKVRRRLDVPLTPMRDISNLERLDQRNKEAEEEGCDENEDEFLRTLDLTNVVGHDHSGI